MPQLFLDLDGVLADFDSGAQQLLNMPPADYESRHGKGAFWKKLATAPDFYNTLPLMPDARELMDAVRHLDPIILTGVPIGKWAEPQKRVWVQRHFPDVQVITTQARNKYTYCEEGDALVDDREQYADAWTQAGGLFILHTSAEESLRELRRNGFL